MEKSGNEQNKYEYILAFGRCSKELRKRLGLYQEELNVELRKNLKSKAHTNYWCQVENNRYYRDNWEEVCCEMAKILKTKYNEYLFYNVLTDIRTPYWIDGVIEKKGEYPVNKFDEWIESSKGIRIGYTSELWENEYKEMMYWYAKSIRFILEKTKSVMGELEGYSDMYTGAIYKIMLPGYYVVRNPLDILYKLNDGLKKLLRKHGYDAPYWLEFIYENNLKKATLHMRKWYIKMLDKEAKCAYTGENFVLDFDEF